LWYGRSAVPRSRGRLASSGSVGVGRTVRSLFAAAVLSRRLACSPPLRPSGPQPRRHLTTRRFIPLLLPKHVKGILPVRPFLSRPCAFCTFLPAKDRSQALGSNPRRRCPALWCRPPRYAQFRDPPSYSSHGTPALGGIHPSLSFQPPPSGKPFIFPSAQLPFYCPPWPGRTGPGDGATAAGAGRLPHSPLGPLRLRAAT
jgi:hypothetical protein